MLLTLQNGYPFPYPTDLTESQQEVHSEAAAGICLDIHGVVHFEWKHTITVEFADRDAMLTAQKLTGWEIYHGLILDAKTSGLDGYDHPAIVALDKAYCGFMLQLEPGTALPVTFGRRKPV
jgi:hypothetical protein